MKILIAYASRNGTVEDCAIRLKKALRNTDVTLVNLAEQMPDITQFDVVVVGSSVRFGKLLKPVASFLQCYEQELQKQPLALFLCNGLAYEYDYYVEKLFSKALRKHAFQCLYFGGSLSLEGLHFFDRLIVRSIRSSIVESEIEDGEYTPSLPAILPETIEMMATYIRAELQKISLK